MCWPQLLPLPPGPCSWGTWKPRRLQQPPVRARELQRTGFLVIPSWPGKGPTEGLPGSGSDGYSSEHELQPPGRTFWSQKGCRLQPTNNPKHIRTHTPDYSGY